MQLRRWCGFLRRVWDSVRIARMPGGGESRDIWKLGPLCLKRWSSRTSPADVRERCRISRAVPACISMWYVPLFHWTFARWIVGEPATHAACNRLLARFPVLRDLHSGNVLVTRRGLTVVDFLPNPSFAPKAEHNIIPRRSLRQHRRSQPGLGLSGGVRRAGQETGSPAQ
jgi:hypothetical protein